ncbi:hypothetical protein SGPA1_50847 [Streptomyces misionensis JCM 4497]
MRADARRRRESTRWGCPRASEAERGGVDDRRQRRRCACRTLRPRQDPEDRPWLDGPGPRRRTPATSGGPCPPTIPAALEMAPGRSRRRAPSPGPPVRPRSPSPLPTIPTAKQLAPPSGSPFPAQHHEGPPNHALPAVTTCPSWPCRPQPARTTPDTGPAVPTLVAAAGAPGAAGGRRGHDGGRRGRVRTDRGRTPPRPYGGDSHERVRHAGGVGTPEPGRRRRGRAALTRRRGPGTGGAGHTRRPGARPVPRPPGRRHRRTGRTATAHRAPADRPPVPVLLVLGPAAAQALAGRRPGTRLRLRQRGHRTAGPHPSGGHDDGRPRLLLRPRRLQPLHHPGTAAPAGGDGQPVRHGLPRTLRGPRHPHPHRRRPGGRGRPLPDPVGIPRPAQRGLTADPHPTPIRYPVMDRHSGGVPRLRSSGDRAPLS